LHQNVPNPFNPTTTIPFVIDTRQHVSLSIYDISGRLIRTLVDRTMDPGVYAEEWSGRDAKGNAVASGVYFYRLSAGNRILTRTAVFLK
jgi:flagellar hook assembly protein FlgD